MKRLLIFLVVLIAFVMSNLGVCAQAVTFEMHWSGIGGYFMTGTFSYDETVAPTIIWEHGEGPTDYLDFLSVSFWDPSMTLLGQWINVENGVSFESSLGFGFDTVNEVILPAGPFMFGSWGREYTGPNDPGEYGYFLTEIPPVQPGPFETFELREFTPAGDLRYVDESPVITVSRVPEPSTMLLLGFGLVGLAGFARRFRKS